MVVIRGGYGIIETHRVPKGLVQLVFYDACDRTQRREWWCSGFLQLLAYYKADKVAQAFGVAPNSRENLSSRRTVNLPLKQGESTLTYIFYIVMASDKNSVTIFRGLRTRPAKSCP